MRPRAGAGEFEPSYKQHAAVDDARGVVLDVSVTSGTVNEREVIESHMNAVRELSGREAAMVTADSGYAYSKVYGRSGAQRRRRAHPGEEGALAEPGSLAPVPLRRAEQHREVSARKDTDPPAGHGAGALLSFEDSVIARAARFARIACRRRGRARWCWFRMRTPALLRASRRHARWGEEERRMHRRHMWRSEGYHGEAKTWRGLARAVRRGLENMKIQSYHLTAAAINLKRLTAALLARLRALWTARVARKRRLHAHRAHPRRAGFLSASA